MNKHLLVAIADDNCIEQAKQLFSSVYFNAGWKGDYMLMAYEVSDEKLEWFRKHGIIVRPCGPLHRGKESGIEYPEADPSLPDEIKLLMDHFKNLPVVLNKFELFTPEFKKWDTVLYLDCDIIVRYSLEKLTRISGFYGISEYHNHNLWKEVRPAGGNKNDPTYKEILKNYNLNEHAFNSGVMAFSTDIIKDDSFAKLMHLYKKYHKNCHVYGEQPILNLYFYKHWKKLNFLYNLPILIWIFDYKVKPEHIDGIILHFFGNVKPWKMESPFYSEWKSNLSKADMIDLNNRPTIKTSEKAMMLIKCSWYITRFKIYFQPSFMHLWFMRHVGLAGIFIKKHRPELYFALKSKKRSGKHLLVAIADDNCIEQAKQLFSSVYFNAGWKGDYMLMAYEVSDEKLEWFRKHGIIVRPCGPLHRGKESGIEYPEISSAIVKPWLKAEIRSHISRFRLSPVVLNKFELFTPEFKKWDTVLYLDCDIIVRYSLEKLTRISGFYAVKDDKPAKIVDQFHHNHSINDPDYKKLESKFDLNSKSFNSGVMAFSTDIIENDGLEKLMKLFLTYHKISTFGEQPILNLYFYKRWRKLHPLYNLYIPFCTALKMKPGNVDAVILHFCAHKKPWLTESPFYAEWKRNLERSDKIDLNDRPIGREIGHTKLRRLHFFLAKIIKKIMESSGARQIEKIVGKAGIYLKKRHPRVYDALKNRS